MKLIYVFFVDQEENYFKMKINLSPIKSIGVSLRSQSKCPHATLMLFDIRLLLRSFYSLEKILQSTKSSQALSIMIALASMASSGERLSLSLSLYSIGGKSEQTHSTATGMSKQFVSLQCHLKSILLHGTLEKNNEQFRRFQSSS